jgi:hypothetical protein
MNFETNNHLVFRYVQYYNCPESRHDEYAETLFFSIPRDSMRFTVKFRHTDTLIKEIQYNFTGPIYSGVFLKFISVEGTIEGVRGQSNEWQVKGNLNFLLMDKFSNIELHQEINISDSFAAYKIIEKKDRHRLFDFMAGF